MSIELRLGETLYKDFITSDPASAQVRDADVLPTCDVFEDATDVAILSPVVTKRVAHTGNYRVPIVCTIANGFTVGHSYNVVVSATVNGYASKAAIETIMIVPARKLGLVVADVGNTAITFKTDLSEGANDWWSKTFLLFIDNATLSGQIKKISSYDAVTKFVTCDTFTGIPVAGDRFQIINF
jgi:hypothetical protein